MEHLWFYCAGLATGGLLLFSAVLAAAARYRQPAQPLPSQMDELAEAVAAAEAAHRRAGEALERVRRLVPVFHDDQQGGRAARRLP